MIKNKKNNLPLLPHLQSTDLQLNFLKTDFSRIHISYEVMQTSHSPGIITSRMNVACGTNTVIP